VTAVAGVSLITTVYVVAASLIFAVRHALDTTIRAAAAVAVAVAVVMAAAVEVVAVVVEVAVAAILG
jgi:hypothetical protein